MTSIDKNGFFKVAYVLIFVVTLLLSIFLIAVFGITFFIRVRENLNPDMSKNVSLYRYYQTNILTNKSSVGFMNIYEELGNDEYFSYQNDNEYFLISNFGTTEYQCTGRCICEQFEDRRSTIALTRGAILFLVAAVTSSIAYGKAKDYFQKKCEEEIFENCQSTSSIHSEVDECHPIHQSESLEGDKKDEITRSEKAEKIRQELGDKRKFWCSGNCLPFDFRKLPAYSDSVDQLDPSFENIVDRGLKLYEEKFGCNNLKLEKSVTYDVPTSGLLQEMGFGKMFPTNEFAALKFTIEDLDNFCVENSEMKIPDDSDPEELNWCCGRNVEWDLEAKYTAGLPPELNPSVRCIEDI